VQPVECVIVIEDEVFVFPTWACDTERLET